VTSNWKISVHISDPMNEPGESQKEQAWSREKVKYSAIQQAWASSKEQALRVKGGCLECCYPVVTTVGRSPSLSWEWQRAESADSARCHSQASVCYSMHSQKLDPVGQYRAV